MRVSVKWTEEPRTCQAAQTSLSFLSALFETAAVRLYVHSKFHLPNFLDDRSRQADLAECIVSTCPLHQQPFLTAHYLLP